MTSSLEHLNTLDSRLSWSQLRKSAVHFRCLGDCYPSNIQRTFLGGSFWGHFKGSLLVPLCVFLWNTSGRLIFIHLQCWEVLPFCRFQRQRCIKILCPKDPDFYTPLALKTAKGQHLPALVVYTKISLPTRGITI